MPRRVSAQTRPDSPPVQTISQPTSISEALFKLRTQWKWAALSQFFFTFNHLFAMSDVSIADIEQDLVHESCIVLPRVMQRLLYILSYDRKVSLDNWQTALRRQYRRRNPTANPIGPEPRVESPEEPPGPVIGETSDAPHEDIDSEGFNANSESGWRNELDDRDSQLPESTRASTLERGLSLDIGHKGLSVQPSDPDSELLHPQYPALNGEEDEQEQSRDWLDLPMLAKLDSMHLLTEWQFHNSTRLRTLMRNDDENASWRIEPIGYDSKKNAYWLIGADRIWIQRPIPKPPKPKNTSTSSSLKRKRAGTATGVKTTPKTKSQAASALIQAKKRPRLQAQEKSPGSTGRARAAKSQAKIKLDAQAMELAELNRQAGVLSRARGGQGKEGHSSPTKIKSKGTRVSARLRGREDEDEWQSVPEEWLEAGNGALSPPSTPINGKDRKGKKKEAVSDLREEEGKPRAGKTGLESDGSEISELTELSEESGKCTEIEVDHESGEGDELVKKDSGPDVIMLADVDIKGLDEPVTLPEGFIEWETICVTLDEWEHIAERFEKATHYAEKALYKLLVNDLVPVVTEELREIERKQRLVVAITQRKRSSRLLLRQSEKEQAEAVARKIAEEKERNSRAKRQEARAKKEEAAREQREIAREMRRREREEKEKMLKGSEDAEDRPLMVVDAVVVEDQGDASASNVAAVSKTEPAVLYDAPSLPSSNHNGSGNSIGKAGTGSGSRTPIGEDWELDCEICHRRGINLDDGTPMMSCGICSKWQHIACHDLADQQAGRRRRNWDVVEFICLQCRSKQAAGYRGGGENLQVQTMSTSGQPYGRSPYIASSYTGSSMQANYSSPVVVSVNGSGGSHVREYQVTDTRPPLTSASLHQQHQQRYAPHSQLPSEQRTYGAPIAFSHYQPQERGFSSSIEQPLYNARDPQLSGHLVPHSTPNGNCQPYQQSHSRWNVTTSQHTSGYNTSRDPNGSKPIHPLPAHPPAYTHWQQQPHSQAIALHSVQQQHVPQFQRSPPSHRPAPP